MALTELQLPTKDNFYRNIQNAATQMDNLMRHWENLAEFIGLVGTADLDAMGVATGQVRTDLVDFRTVLNEVVAFYNGTSTSQTKVPSEIADKIRTM